MRHKFIVSTGLILTACAVMLAIAGCNYPTGDSQPAVQDSPPLEPTAVETIRPIIPDEPRDLTICMPNEPSSLFIYADTSISARSIRQAIYDGPIDVRDYQPVPVILENIPTITNGGVRFEPVSLQPGAQMVDSNGLQVTLEEGVTYLPAGCPDFSCAIVYSGGDPIQIDQQVVRFTLKAGINWQDGERLKASDSQYAFEVAKAFYPSIKADLLNLTNSYVALDEVSVEWRGVPGYRYSGYYDFFFSPLPEHAWGSIPIEELLTAEVSSRMPMGWGAYTIEAWLPGDHILLTRNPDYFRQAEGLPHFDRLVYRFISEPADAIGALLAGECDYLGESYSLKTQLAELKEAETTGKLALIETKGPAWEQVVFGISSLSSEKLPILQGRQVRQAIAYCSDREKIAGMLFDGNLLIPDSYVSPDHPLANPDIKKYPFDPAAGNQLLESAGWIDTDNNPATPRIALGINGVPDGIPLELELLQIESVENQLISGVLQESLIQCGINLIVKTLSADQMFSSGISSPVFGRNFDMTQFAWMASSQPDCFIFTSPEIPGPYPEFVKGWGGSNPSGYSSPDFDRACQRAMSTMPDDPGYLSAHFLAQSIFSEDLPAMPLYLHPRQIVIQPNLCQAGLDSSAKDPMWNVEEFYFGDDCSR